MAAAALGAHDATSHTLSDRGARGDATPESADWLLQQIEETRAALDPIVVATAAASARERPIERSRAGRNDQGRRSHVGVVGAAMSSRLASRPRLVPPW
jgi:hypothetical protein